VHVKDVEAPDGVKVLDDQDLMVVHIAAKMSEAKLESLLAREAGEVVAPVATAEKPKVEAAAAPAAAAAAAAPDSKAKESKK
jgi:large subunit ribosomal protein L25